MDDLREARAKGWSCARQSSNLWTGTLVRKDGQKSLKLDLKDSRKDIHQLWYWPEGALCSLICPFTRVESIQNDKTQPSCKRLSALKTTTKQVAGLKMRVRRVFQCYGGQGDQRGGWRRVWWTMEEGLRPGWSGDVEMGPVRRAGWCHVVAIQDVWGELYCIVMNSRGNSTEPWGTPEEFTGEGDGFKGFELDVVLGGWD